MEICTCSNPHVPISPPLQALSPKRKQQDDEGPPGSRSRGSTPTQPLKKLKVNVFKVHKCAVCSFTTEDLVTFHDHIPQHKSDRSILLPVQGVWSVLHFSPLPGPTSFHYPQAEGAAGAGQTEWNRRCR